MKDFIEKMLKKKSVVRISQEERAQRAFEMHARSQFKRLKDKGLGITVFSL